MPRSKHDFFSDPQWPLSDAGPSSTVHKHHSSDSSINEQSKGHQINKSTIMDNTIYDAENRSLKLSISIQKLTPVPNQDDSQLAKLEDLDIKAYKLLQSQFIESQSINEEIGLKIEEFSQSNPHLAKLEEMNNKLMIRQSHGRYKILCKQAKQFLVDQIQATSLSYVSKFYGISVNNLCRWKKTCDRRTGAGRKVMNMKMEVKLIEWIKIEQSRQTCRLSRRQIQERAKKWSNDSAFKASKGWFERFAKRNQELHLIEYFGMKLKSSCFSSLSKKQFKCSNSIKSQKLEAEDPLPVDPLFSPKTRSASRMANIIVKAE